MDFIKQQQKNLKLLNDDQCDQDALAWWLSPGRLTEALRALNASLEIGAGNAQPITPDRWIIAPGVLNPHSARLQFKMLESD
jgi:hypothetical protein